MNRMFSFCSQTYQVKKTVHNFFDEYRYKLYKTGLPFYILDGLLCDGADEPSHQQCDRSCYFLWHEDWLEGISNLHLPKTKGIHANKPDAVANEITQPVQEIPFCQLTNIHDLAQKNSWFNDFFQMRTKILRTWKRTLRFGWNRLSRQLRPSPRAESLKEDIDGSIQEGDIVKIKSWDELRKLLDDRGRYRRLFFINEMYEFCDKEYIVLKVIDSYYDEARNKMCKSKNVVILEDVECSGRQRLYRTECDRSCFFFWHTAWLKKTQ